MLALTARPRVRCRGAEVQQGPPTREVPSQAVPPQAEVQPLPPASVQPVTPAQVQPLPAQAALQQVQVPSAAALPLAVPCQVGTQLWAASMLGVALPCCPGQRPDPQVCLQVKPSWAGHVGGLHQASRASVLRDRCLPHTVQTPTLELVIRAMLSE